MTGDRKGSKGRYMTGKQVDNYLNWQAEVKRLRDRIEWAISTLRSQPNDLEDGPDYHRELLSLYSQMISHAVDVLEGKE